MASTTKFAAGTDVEGKRAFDLQYIKYEEGRLMRDNVLIREPWVGCCH